MINKILDTVGNMFARGKSMPKIASLFPILRDLKELFDQYSDINPKECGKLVIQKYIKVLNLMITLELDKSRQAEYCMQLENAYKLAARVSLEHFIIYYEWEEEEKLLEKRYGILQAYIYYLNRMCFDETFEGMIVNLPSGYGKSRVCRYYEAFRLRIAPRRNIFGTLF